MNKRQKFLDWALSIVNGFPHLQYHWVIWHDPRIDETRYYLHLGVIKRLGYYDIIRPGGGNWENLSPDLADNFIPAEDNLEALNAVELELQMKGYVPEYAE